MGFKSLILKYKKTFLRLSILGILILSCSVFAYVYCNYQIINYSKNKTYQNVEEIPFRRVGLLLGTGKYLKNNRLNPYYQNRILACVDLIKGKKIKFLVISGDNSRKNYNEPQMMKDDLIKNGVDSTIIFLDYAGFRTFDSVIRLREIFGQDSVTFISQKFHNERAIFIGNKEGVDGIGFNAKDVLKVNLLRERLARVKVFVDYMIGTKPKFLGKKIILE